MLIWMSEREMLLGQRYLLKRGPLTVGTIVVSLKYRINVDTLAHLASKTLKLNQVGRCNSVVEWPTTSTTSVASRKSRA